MDKPRIAVTMGDVAGVGPEIIVRILGHEDIVGMAQLIVFGSRQILEYAARCLGRALPDWLQTAASVKSWREDNEYHWIYDPPVDAPAHQSLDPRRTEDPTAASAAVGWIRAAVQACLVHDVAAVVTCPINKAAMHKAGINYPGHTELIAELCGAEDYRMCLFTDQWRIVHNTGHVSLRGALDAVRRERIIRTIHVGWDALRRMQIPGAHIAVAGVNPHAGEGGLFGTEEAEEIAPAIETCRAEGIPCSGPYPPDTVFRRMVLGEFSMVIAMYHDQGHIPLKLIAMDKGVNVTLGLPIVRTSVDHGTAYDIAYRNKADERSLCAAIRLAVQLATPAAARHTIP